MYPSFLTRCQEEEGTCLLPSGREVVAYRRVRWEGDTNASELLSMEVTDSKTHEELSIEDLEREMGGVREDPWDFIEDHAKWSFA